MGNTFDMVIEKKAIHGMQTKLTIMSQYLNVINLCDKDTDNFLFIVKPAVSEYDNDDDANWEGGFNFLKKSIDSNMDQLKKQMNNIQSKSES